MVDCSLLTYKSSLYLLPTVAIAEAIILPMGFTFNLDSTIVANYEWHQEFRPILTLDLLPIDNAKIKNPKIAFIHSMQPQSSQPFFAVLFEGQTRRLKISPENIAWADEAQNVAMLTEKKSQTEVILVDLAGLSKEAELSSADTQIAK